MILGVLFQKLPQIPQGHVAAILLSFRMTRESEQGLIVTGELQSMLIKTVSHFLVALLLFNEHRVNERIEIVGIRFVMIRLLRQPKLPHFFVLVRLKKTHGGLDQVLRHIRARLPRDMQPVQNNRRDVLGRLATTGKPTPAAVCISHGLQTLESGAGHAFHFGLVKNRLLWFAFAVEALPALSSLLCITDLLCIQVHSLVTHGLQIHSEILQHSERDHRRHKAVQRLLRATIRVVRQIRERIDQ